MRNYFFRESVSSTVRKLVLAISLIIAEMISPVKMVWCMPFKADKLSASIPPVSEPRKVAIPKIRLYEAV